jgi:arabinogalactan oligomer/maltooligosaccharide transport system permease protein
LLIPWAVPTYISAFSWRWLFNSKYGFFNLALKALGADPIPWLSHQVWAMVAVIATNIWLGFPFMMVVLLGGLQSIPREMYEASEVDGCGRIRQFWTITLPLLKPVALTATLLGIIWTFNMFNIIYLVTEGGPHHQTDILATFAFIEAFHQWRFGMATTYAVIILSILLSFSFFYIRTLKGSEEIY